MKNFDKQNLQLELQKYIEENFIDESAEENIFIEASELPSDACYAEEPSEKIFYAVRPHLKELTAGIFPKFATISRAS